MSIAGNLLLVQGLKELAESVIRIAETGVEILEGLHGDGTSQFPHKDGYQDGSVKLEGFLNVREEKAGPGPHLRDLFNESVDPREVFVNEDGKVGIRCLGYGGKEIFTGPCRIGTAYIPMEPDDPFLNNLIPV